MGTAASSRQDFSLNSVEKFLQFIAILRFDTFPNLTNIYSNLYFSLYGKLGYVCNFYGTLSFGAVQKFNFIANSPPPSLLGDEKVISKNIKISFPIGNCFVGGNFGFPATAVWSH
jgi:hypothetical protein